uniref:Uncharacterized protein n=1 Tax=Siphoviridae sp. ctFBb37 TaxID=2827565 RepID=A0A8S5RS27_9CAUD|nr:MAG TPA: hypothetical protein [Siphoviridae sp. ctFBb37]
MLLRRPVRCQLTGHFLHAQQLERITALCVTFVTR